VHGSAVKISFLSVFRWGAARWAAPCGAPGYNKLGTSVAYWAAG